MATLSESRAAASPAGAPRPPLRVALCLPRRHVPRVLAEALGELAEAPWARIVLIVAGQRPPPALPWPWRAWGRLERALFGDPRRALQRIDVTAAFPGAPTLPAGTDGTPSTWRRPTPGEAIDVVLALEDADPGPLAGRARFGVWRVDFGDPADNPPGREGYHGIAIGRRVCRVRLTASLPGGGHKLLDTAWLRPLPLSAGHNRVRLLRRAGQLPVRLLRALHRTGPAGWADFPALPDTAAPREPSPTSALAEVAGAARGMARRSWEKLTRQDQWFLAYRFDAEARPLDTPGRFRCLVPPPDRFWADPFPWERDGRHYIFFEELPFARRIAHIAVAEIDARGMVGAPRTVLRRPYHLSYPFLVEEDGVLYMIPESGMNGTVELYRCRAFPDAWEAAGVLLTLPCCADATLHRAEGRWWMFVNVGADGSDVHDELFLYSAERLTGDWQPHPKNPVKSDVRSARPAGGLFRRGGQTLRPGQVGVPHYGAGIALHRVVTLTPTDYREEITGWLHPPAGSQITGLHTYNRAGRLTVVDGFMQRPRLGARLPHHLSPRYEAAPERLHAAG